MNAITAVGAAIAATFELAEGEAYAGVMLNDNGTPSHHVILLPGDVEMIHRDATAWAASIGGELPTRREQSLLFANAKQHFQGNWYWSSEQHASGESYAWFQHFIYGDQLGNDKSSELRARAVRRLPI